MARPKKSGLSYFPMDVDYYNDDRVFELSMQYGPKGHAVYFAVLTEVYRAGYYISVPLERLANMIIRNIGAQWFGGRDEVLDIMDCCASLGLFDPELYSKGIITSRSIQRRYAAATSRRKTAALDYWLLPETANAEEYEQQSAEEITVSAAETEVIAAETRVNVYSNPPKKTKENQRKENESRSDQNQIRSDPHDCGICGTDAADEMMTDIAAEFERIKRLTQDDLVRIEDFCMRYGEETVREAARETVRRGGKSLVYTEKVLATMTAVRSEPCFVMTAWEECGCVDNGDNTVSDDRYGGQSGGEYPVPRRETSGRYAPSENYADAWIGSMMDDW